MDAIDEQIRQADIDIKTATDREERIEFIKGRNLLIQQKTALIQQKRK